MAVSSACGGPLPKGAPGVLVSGRIGSETMRQIAVDLPDEIARQLEGKGRALPQRLLEALAVDAYQLGEITAAQVQEILGLRSRWEVEAFLKEHRAYLPYTEADLEADLGVIQRVTQL